MALEASTIALADPSLLHEQAYIDGEWCDADDGATFDVTNPANGEVLGRVPRMGASETRRAVEGSHRAQADWASRPAAERASILRALRDLMFEHRDDLALLLTLEQGKPLAESQAEIAYAVSFWEWFGEESKRVYGDTIVLKPAEQTPLSALAVAELASRAGLPAGVLSIVTGDGFDAPEIGGELTSNPNVRKVGFTGSGEIGKLIMRQCADQVKNVSLELGDRILVHESLHDEFVAGLRTAAAGLVVGVGTDARSSIGPLIDQPAFDKVSRHVTDALDRGARPLLGGGTNSSTGSWASTPASSRSRWRRSAAPRSPGSAARAPSTGSMTGCRRAICHWEGSNR